MRVLKYGMKGDDVSSWELFLCGQGYYYLEVNGVFEEATKEATEGFQRDFGLDDDGEVGPKTLEVARRIGFEDAPTKEDDYPPKPTNLRGLASNEEREAVFGKFSYTPASSDGWIIIDPKWVAANIVSITIPQLAEHRIGPPKVQFHRLCVQPVLDLFAAWERAEMLYLLKSWAGSFAPRFQRGSRTRLSNHAWATAFDINAAWNPLHAKPAKLGATGCVRELVPIANSLGWFWGGHWDNPRDGMHFEYTGRRP